MKSNPNHLVILALAFLLLPLALFAQSTEATPNPDSDALSVIVSALMPVVQGVLGKYGWLSQVVMIIGLLRVIFKPLMTYFESRAAETPGTEDDEQLARFERGPVYKVIHFILDFGGSIKLSSLTTNQGQMKIISLLTTAALMALIGSGCKTGPDGKRVVDLVKVEAARDLITPAASSTIRRVLLNSPQHAPLIAKYANSVGGVFCTMSLSNEFRPEFLIDQIDILIDPELAKVADGFALDLRNTAYGVYKMLWRDAGRAEIPPDQWLHQVCQLFCESISQGLADAGYPGGVKRTSWNLRRDLMARIGPAETWTPLWQPRLLLR
jgi:hypothetical protein